MIEIGFSGRPVFSGDLTPGQDMGMVSRARPPRCDSSYRERSVLPTKAETAPAVSEPRSGGNMATSAKPALWKRLAIILSAIVVGIVVGALIGQAGGSTILVVAAGAAAVLLTLFATAAILHVPLTKGWR
jgi:hypothetical protein